MQCLWSITRTRGKWGLVAIFFWLTALSAYGVSAKVALIHFFPTLGDVNGNVTRLNALVEQALQNGANIVIAPECATTGFSITRQQVLDGLGFTAPYPQLAQIKSLAHQYHGYVFIGIAEVMPQNKVYNTVIVYGPDGLVETQEKRGLSGWHDRGDIPFQVVTTPYGDIATIICSDSYLPDWLRIVTLEGADIVVLPANWWGNSGQLNIWQTRARENGIWFLTANRWGVETDTRFGTPFVYNMNDAPSAVIKPDGGVQLVFKAEDEANPVDKILYSVIDVPDARIGNKLNPVYSVDFRRPSAYGAIGNTYYRPDMNNQPAPDLPSAGPVTATTVTYQPDLANPNKNLLILKNLWAQYAKPSDVVVLPGFGMSMLPASVSSSNWYRKGVWGKLQAFVEQNDIKLLITSLLAVGEGGSPPHEDLAVFRPNVAPLLRQQIHDALTGEGSGEVPLTVDLATARVGILLGRDALFPETTTAEAKVGTDLLVVTSTVGTVKPLNGPAQFSTNYFWPVTQLQGSWDTATDHVYHLIASDWTGNGAVIENAFGGIGTRLTASSTTPVQSLTLDTSEVRTKFLNAYYSFDLDALLSTQANMAAQPSKSAKKEITRARHVSSDCSMFSSVSFHASSSSSTHFCP